jgi:hypothetical protein
MHGAPDHAGLLAALCALCTRPFGIRARGRDTCFDAITGWLLTGHFLLDLPSNFLGCWCC